MNRKFEDGVPEVAPKPFTTQTLVAHGMQAGEVKTWTWIEAQFQTEIVELPDGRQFQNDEELPKHRPFLATLKNMGFADTPDGESWAFIFEKVDGSQFGYRVTLSRSDKRKAERAKRELRDIGWSGRESRGEMIGQTYRLRPATHKDRGMIASKKFKPKSR